MTVLPMRCQPLSTPRAPKHRNSQQATPSFISRCGNSNHNSSPFEPSCPPRKGLSQVAGSSALLGRIAMSMSSPAQCALLQPSCRGWLTSMAQRSICSQGTAMIHRIHVADRPSTTCLLSRLEAHGGYLEAGNNALADGASTPLKQIEPFSLHCQGSPWLVPISQWLGRG